MREEIIKRTKVLLMEGALGERLAKDLHTSNLEVFANEMGKLQKSKGLKIFGGCCGTDNKYMERVANLLTR